MERATRRLEQCRQDQFFNLSSVSLTPLQADLLRAGLKFIPCIPTPHRSSRLKLRAALRRFVRSVAIKLFFQHQDRSAPSPIPAIRYSTWFPPADATTTLWYQPLLTFQRTALAAIPELPPGVATPSQPPAPSSEHRRPPLPPSLLAQASALALRQLQDNPFLVIQPADKNLGACLMDADLYHLLCQQHLRCSKTYEITPHQPTRVFAGLRRLLSAHGRLRQGNSQPTRLARSLLQLEKSPQLKHAAFHIIPKLHKNPLTGRPIVNTIDSPTYWASRYLHNVLQPLITQHVPSVVQSSSTALTSLGSMKTTHSHCVLCADVVALYPSIPINFGVSQVQAFLLLVGTPAAECAFLVDLLRWTLENNYFMYKDKSYHQLQGTAMGIPGATAYANIVLFMMERPLLTQCHRYLRFIDDLCIVCDRDVALTLVEQFNSVNPSIQLDSVTYASSGVFLDLTVSITPPTVSTCLYQKPLNRYQYLPLTSQHGHYVFTNLVRSEVRRYRLHCSSSTDFAVACALLAKRLQWRGYPRQFTSNLIACCPSRADLLAAVHRPRAPTSTAPMLFYPPGAHPLSPTDLTDLPMAVTHSPQYQTAYNAPTMVVRLNPPNIWRLTAPRLSRLSHIPCSPLNPEPLPSSPPKY